MIKRFSELHYTKPELSFAAIAVAMSAEFGVTLTRNAMIGKAHRLNLPTRGRRKKVRKSIKQKKARLMKLKSRAVDTPIVPALEPVVVSPYGLTIYQLRDGVCKWPLGPALERPPFFYCGEPAEIGCPYCWPHTERAHGRKVA